jgi:hypothetical protein
VAHEITVRINRLCAAAEVKLCTKLVIAGLALLSLAISPRLALANQQPAGINLGQTSFFDGFGPTTDGFTYQVYFVFANATAIYDGDGNQVPVFNDPRITTYALVNQLTYFLPVTFFDGAVRPGIDAILPLVLFDSSFGMPGAALTDNGIGFGDLTVGPVFQFSPIMVEGHPIFSHRLGLDVILPIGAYDPSKNLNQSSNFVSLNPNWAATMMLAKGLEVSVRLNYLFNLSNDRPTNPPIGPMGMPLAVESAQAGQAIWLNFAASYEIVRSLHVGANGYYFKQLTEDKYRLADGTEVNGDQVGQGKAQVLGIGPGALWDPDADHGNQLFANLYFQTLVEARASAIVVNLRWLHTF